MEFKNTNCPADLAATAVLVHGLFEFGPLDISEHIVEGFLPKGCRDKVKGQDSIGGDHYAGPPKSGVEKGVEDKLPVQSETVSSQNLAQAALTPVAYSLCARTLMVMAIAANTVREIPQTTKMNMLLLYDGTK